MPAPQTIAALDPQGADQSAPQGAASRVWRTEIEWCAMGGEAYFRAVARPTEGSEEVVVAESARLPWPPSGAAAAPALTTAAEELENGLLAAGWRPLPPGDAWYAKRFAWEPVASARAADGRFKREDTRGEGSPPDGPAPISTPMGRAT